MEHRRPIRKVGANVAGNAGDYTHSPGFPTVLAAICSRCRLDRKSAKERLYMMNQTDGWMGMGGWMGGSMWIWAVIATLVVVLLVVLIMKVSKK